MAEPTASDNNALLLQISQDLNHLKRQWELANGIADDQMTRMERRAKKMAQQIEKDAGEGGKMAGQALAKQFTGEAGKAIVFNRMQMMELAHVARSVMDGLAAGQSPTRLLAMEGGRLAEVFGMGSGGAAGAMAGFGKLLNPVTIGIAAVAAVLIGLVAAEQSYEKEHQKLLVTLMGTASASGLTIDSLNGIITAADAVNHATVAMNRQAAEAFLTIGHVSRQNLPAALSLIKDYAAKTGQDLPVAIERLAKAFAEPGKGALDLSKDLNYLNAEQLKTIERLDASGDHASATAEMIKDLQNNVHGAAGELNGLGQVLSSIAGFFKNAAEWAGKFGYEATHIDAGKVLTTMRSQLAAYQQQLKTYQQDQKAGGGLVRYDAEIKSTQKMIDTLTTNIKAAEAKTSQKAALSKVETQNNTSLAVQADIDAANPQAKALKDEIARRAGMDADLKTAQDLAKNGATPQLRQSGANQITEILQAQSVLDRKIKEMKDAQAGVKPGAAAAALHADDSAASGAKQASDAAHVALLRAMADLTGNIRERAAAEKEMIDAELAQSIDQLKARKKAIDDNEKLTAPRKAQLKAEVDKAIDDQTTAATTRKTKIDIDAENAEDQKALDRRKTRVGFEIAAIDLQAQMATTLKERQALELEALRKRKELADAERAAALKAKLRLADAANAARSDGTQPVAIVSDDGAQKAADKAYDLDRQRISRQGPLADYARGIKDLDTEMQLADVRGLQGLTDGMAQLIVTGGKLGNVLHQVLQQLELDLARMGIQQAGSALLKWLGVPGFDGGGYTGSGARAGGVDGKGGFLAIMHPRETVIDHTKSAVSILSGIGGSASARSVGSASMTLNLHSTYDLKNAVATSDVHRAISESHKSAVATALDLARGAQQGWAGVQAWEHG